MSQNIIKYPETKMNLSTAYHPQTDGNTERVHRTIEQILRAFVHNCPEEWIRHLQNFVITTQDMRQQN